VLENQQPLTLLCLAHLNWDHVWQRPQQLMTRFARRCRVIYADPPQVVDRVDMPYFEERQGHGGVRVVRPIFPGRLFETSGASFDETYETLWSRMLPELLDQAGPNTILWVFSPRADYLVKQAEPYVRVAVYDCMDDLASFRGAEQDIRQREARLLEEVALVTTGGFSMYQARKHLHPNVHCFPSGVDVAHYRQVQEPTTTVPDAVEALPHPRLGYFGVLDERIDWPLIGEVAARRPEWQWVLVGPFAKVDESELPSAPNIHYLGGQAYTDLPRFLKGFDIATMPFALNEATRYISPTKTLEYLAGRKPVVSSSVPDVVAFYKEIVYIADGADGWITAIEQILASSDDERAARLERAIVPLEQSSWDSIAERMWGLIMEALKNKSVV
jgi:glycosyltransferase involved in cell wall biosynthesis